MAHRRRAPLTGAVAGVLTTLVFAALHQLLISDIWFSIAPMLLAGALCGGALAWSYALLFERATLRTWAAWNAAFMASLVLLGVASLLLYEPVTSTALLVSGNEPPTELIVAALPLTLLFTVGAAAVISWLWGRTSTHFAAVLLTATILIVLFGLNVSVIGMVEMTGDAVYLVGLFFALIFAVLAGNAGFFYLLERRRLFADAAAGDGGPSQPAMESPQPLA
jgi:hypothetical protein